MRLHRSATTSIELTHLKPGLRRLLESVIDGGEVTVCRDGVAVGRLSFTVLVFALGHVVPALSSDFGLILAARVLTALAAGA